MSTILVVDDAAVFREPIAASLRLAGYETVCASNGNEAAAVLSQRKFDLILLDLAMPQMDGLSFLRGVRSDPVHSDIPVILLTAFSQKASVVEAGRLRVQGYLLKSTFSLDQLLGQVRTHISRKRPAAETAKSCAPGSGNDARLRNENAVATDGAPIGHQSPQSGRQVKSRKIVPLMTKEECVQRVAKALEAKTLSGVVTQVISLAASPRTDVTQLAALISRDPMLSTRVLRAANSPIYASNRGMVTTISDAVKNVGCATVRNVASAMGIFDAMPKTGSDGFNPIRCWQHSFGVARLCEQLVSESGGENSGVAYLVGLCHDLGEILLRSTFATEYQQVLEVQAQTGLCRHDVERDMLGISHNELVVSILRSLGLPDIIRVPIEAFYAAPANRPLSSRRPSLSQVLSLANLYAHGLLLASSGSATVMPLTLAECSAVTGHESPMQPDGMSFRSEILLLTGMLAGFDSDATNLLKPLFEQRSTRIWIARDRTYSEFDPVSAAIGSLAEASVHDYLPREAADWADYSGLVVIAPTDSARDLGRSEIEQSLALRPEGAASTLWLVNKSEPATAAAASNLEPKTFPISLDQLASFVDTLCESKVAA